MINSTNHEGVQTFIVSTIHTDVHIWFLTIYACLYTNQTYMSGVV